MRWPDLSKKVAPTLSSLLSVVGKTRMKHLSAFCISSRQLSCVIVRGVLLAGAAHSVVVLREPHGLPHAEGRGVGRDVGQLAKLHLHLATALKKIAHVAHITLQTLEKSD